MPNANDSGGFVFHFFIQNKATATLDALPNIHDSGSDRAQFSNPRVCI